MNITIIIYNYGTYFEARINDWYIAQGDTKKEAVKNVLKRLESETSYR